MRRSEIEIRALAQEVLELKGQVAALGQMVVQLAANQPPSPNSVVVTPWHISLGDSFQN